MTVIYIDERTPQGKKVLAQLKQPKAHAIINPFPLSLLEKGLYAFFDMLFYAIQWFVDCVANVLRRLFKGK